VAKVVADIQLAPEVSFFTVEAVTVVVAAVLSVAEDSEDLVAEVDLAPAVAEPAVAGKFIF